MIFNLAIISSSLYRPPCFIIIINFCFFKALLVHVTTGSLSLIAILPNQFLLSQLFEHIITVFILRLLLSPADKLSVVIPLDFHTCTVHYLL